jgi:hypothetical protein
MPIIKKVGDQCISLEETTIAKWDRKLWLAVTLSLLVGFVLAFVVDPSDLLLMIGTGIIFGFVIAIPTFTYLALRHPSRVKAYRIYIKDQYISRTIESTTPEADQISICKTAQELEKIALELNDKDAALEIIARKCK